MGSLTANAQLDLPDGGSNIPDVPIDGFLSIGLIAGACIDLHKKIKALKEQALRREHFIRLFDLFSLIAK